MNQPKTGLFNASVLCINPTQEELAKLYNTEINKAPKYIGETKNGDKYIRLDVFIKEEKLNSIFKLSYFISNKFQESKSTPGNFQWVNNAGNTRWAKDEKQIKEKTTNGLYENFAKRPFRKCYMGEADFMQFLNIYLLQGKQAEDSFSIPVNTENLFSGNVDGLNALIAENREHSEGITALATIVAGEDDKEYQGVWKEIAPAWWLSFLLSGDTKPYMDKWLDGIKGAYGCKDEYSLSSLGGNKEAVSEDFNEDQGLPF